MEEIEFKLRNDTTFCRLSKEFPDVTILRWCSSIIDYVEVYGSSDRSLEVSAKLEEVTVYLHSSILNTSAGNDSLSAAISCRCSVENSTIRLAETMNLLWVAPATYRDGFEMIKLVSFSQEDTSKFFEHVSSHGEANITRKTKIDPDSLRQIYTVSLGEIFGKLSGKQLTYLRDAVSMGLFSTPRKIMIEDLAKKYGLSKSTMQEHINKARSKLIQSMEPYINLFLLAKR